MFENSVVLPLFPTFVWFHDLKQEQYRPMNERILAKLEKLLTPRPPLPPSGQWQTEQNLHELPEFAELVKCIRFAAKGVLDYMQVDYEGYEITGCWANINPPGARHKPHIHPNNYLSGVYYVQTQAGADSITVVDPRPQASVISPKLKVVSNHNADEINLGAKDGRMLLFPAWLPHTVGLNSSNRERISIAFNIMFTDFTNRMSRPKWKGTVTVKQKT